MPGDGSDQATGAILRRALAVLPRVRLGIFPSPVRRLADGLWLKDEAPVHPAYGGNKVRKWERLLPTLAGRRPVLWGDAASHTLHAAAALGAAVGTPPLLVVYDSGGTDAAADWALLHAHGAAVHHARGFLHAAALARWTAWRSGGVLVPLGATGAATSAAWAEAALELEAQVAAGALPPPARIVLALGSGGTVAGLLVGLAAGVLPSRVLAVRATPRWLCPPRRLRRQVARTVALLGLSPALAAAAWSRLDLDDGQLGGGYRAQTPAARRALEEAAGLGLRLDPAFTAKAWAALAALRAAGDRGPHLFWNTHAGAPP